MARFAAGLLLAATMAASAPGWAHWEARPAHAPPSTVRAAGPASQHHTHVPPVHYPHIAPAPSRFMPPAAIYPAVRAIVATTMAARPAYPPARAVASPYYVVVGSGYAGPGLVYPAEPNWNWTPVESVAALAGRAVAGRSDVRFYCPDTREYFPLVQTCPSQWLKVIP